jgi:benzodiazapine receptor
MWGTRKPPSILWLGLFAGATAVVARLGNSATSSPPSPWYRALSKPKDQPASWVSRPVWSTLYGLMALSAFRILRHRPSPRRDRALKLWWLQLALNGAWSPLFFGARKPRLALADLVAMTAALGSYTWLAHKVDRPAAWMMTPYLGWLGYAGYLNAAGIRQSPRLA